MYERRYRKVRGIVRRAEMEVLEESLLDSRKSLRWFNANRNENRQVLRIPTVNKNSVTIILKADGLVEEVVEFALALGSWGSQEEG